MAIIAQALFPSLIDSHIAKLEMRVRAASPEIGKNRRTGTV